MIKTAPLQGISCRLIFCAIVFSFALYAKDVEQSLIISIPISEEKLLEHDNYFVSLKRAYHALNIKVNFVVMPGARSLLMLQKGKIAGNYPRYSVITKQSNSMIGLSNFEFSHNLYAFSLSKINSEHLSETIKLTPSKIGVVRGVKVIEEKYSDINIHWFSHLDHLIGSLQLERVQYIFEREEAIIPYQSETLHLYRSVEPVFIGKLTHVLHVKHADIAKRLDAYFKQKPVN